VSETNWQGPELSGWMQPKNGPARRMNASELRMEISRIQRARLRVQEEKNAARLVVQGENNEALIYTALPSELVQMHLDAWEKELRCHLAKLASGGSAAQSEDTETVKS
jgi:hypothetical protein